MFSSKLFNLILFFSLTVCSSCGFFQNSVNTNSTNQNVHEPQNETVIPTKEPENYQLEIVVKSDDEEQKTLVAKNGKRFFSITNDIATLKIDENKTYLINFDKKNYTENLTVSTAYEDSAETLQSFLTTEWLNKKTDAIVEKIGEENGLTKYRTSFDESESVIYIDEKIQLPVKQEFYSVNGEARKLMYSNEILNFKLSADETFFEVPKGFIKVSLQEFQHELDREK